MVSIPARSLPPIQQAIQNLTESGTVTDCNEIITELKSEVDARKELINKSEPDYQHEY